MCDSGPSRFILWLCMFSNMEANMMFAFIKGFRNKIPKGGVFNIWGHQVLMGGVALPWQQYWIYADCQGTQRIPPNCIHRYWRFCLTLKEGNRSQVNALLIQHLFSRHNYEWFFSWVTSTALHSDTNSHCLFMTTESILISMAGKWDPSLQNKHFQLQLWKDGQLRTPRDKTFFGQIVSYTVLHTWLKSQWIGCVQFAAVESFYFQKPTGLLFNGPCAKQWNSLCPNMVMGENRSDLPQTLAEHEPCT